MKKTFAIALAIFSFASMAFGDEVDQGLPNIASEQLKASIEEMMRSGIDRDTVVKMTRIMLENRFRQEHLLRAHEIIMNAHEEKLPLQPIVSKAYEGIAKRIQDRNIVQAMEKVRSRYSSAYKQAQELTEEREQIRLMGNIIAGCLAAGMNDYDVERIIYRLRYRSQQMTRAQADELAVETFKAAKEMTRLGVASGATTDVVCQALQHRYGAREMLMMRKSFLKNSRDSSPTSVAEGFTNAIRTGESVESIRSSRSLGSGGTGRQGGSGSGGHGGGPGGGGGGRR